MGGSQHHILPRWMVHPIVVAHGKNRQHRRTFFISENWGTFPSVPIFCALDGSSYSRRARKKSTTRAIFLYLGKLGTFRPSPIFFRSPFSPRPFFSKTGFERARLQRLRKNSDFDRVLKGCGFSRAVSAAKSAAALAAGEMTGREKTFSAACSAVPPKPENEMGL